MFIVLEGGDGTGKSTQVKKIAGALGGTAYATPPAEFRKRAGEVKRDATPAQQYEFFKSGLIAGSIEISEMLAEDQLVVCDRYWITTLTYHQEMGIEVDVADFRGIIMPHVTFLLTTPADAQLVRLQEREMDAGDKRMLNAQEALANRFFANLTLHKQPFFTVDTAALNEEQTTDVICSITRYIK
jgi:thymidylate kinase